jgi:hypothetical protein
MVVTPKFDDVAADTMFAWWENVWNAGAISINVINRTNVAMLFCFKIFCLRL